MLTGLGRFAIALLAAGLLVGCAGYDGFGLQPGSRIEDAEQLMGVPAMRWTEADGGQTLVYPRGPMGYHTFFVRSDAMGYIVSRENVLVMRHFARIQAGMTTEPTVSQMVKSGDAKVLVDLRTEEGTKAALGGLYPAASFYVQNAWADRFCAHTAGADEWGGHHQ